MKRGAKKGFDIKLGEGPKFLRNEVHWDTVIMPQEDQGEDILHIASKEDIPVSIQGIIQRNQVGGVSYSQRLSNDGVQQGPKDCP